MNGTVGGVDGAKSLYRSTDNGATWTALDTPPGTYYTSPLMNAAISADKTNANLVYVSGYEMPIYRVDASGTSGQTPSQQYTDIAEINTTDAALNYGKPHPDHMALAYAPNGSLLNANHGGLFRLGAPGSAASATNYWVSANGNLGVSEIHDIAYDNLSKVLVGGFQDNGVAYQTAQGSQTWTRHLNAGDGGDVAVDNVTLAASGQSARYASAQNLSNFKRYVFDSSNNQVSAIILSTSVITDKQFISSLALNAVDPKRLLIGGSGNLYESSDMGATIASAFPAGATPVGVNALTYQAPMAYGGYENGGGETGRLLLRIGQQGLQTNGSGRRDRSDNRPSRGRRHHLRPRHGPGGLDEGVRRGR